MFTYVLSFSVLALLRYMHGVGLQGLYLEYWYYDIIMHCLGGLGVGLLTLAVLRSFAPKYAPYLLQKKSRMMWAVICGAFVFGLCWELFEVYYDIAGYHLWTVPYYLDTLKDLMDDCIGGAVASLLVLFKR